MTDSTEQPVVWAIRYTQLAINDIFVAWRHFDASAGTEIADAWEDGLKEEIAKLAQFPQRFSSENAGEFFSVPVRRMLYRRTRRGPAHHLYFTLQTSAEDAPTLLIMHPRHAAQAPINWGEAREIESSE